VNTVVRVFMALLVLLLAAVPAAAEPAGRIDMLIGFHWPPGTAEQAMVRGAGGDITHTFHLVPVIAASLPQSAVDVLLGHPGVRYVEPVIGVQAIWQSVPWNIERVFADEEYPFATWNTTRGEEVGVAVLDTGIDRYQIDLNVRGGTSTIDGQPWGYDGHGHGTWVAGVIAALDNDVGVVGVAPLVELYAVRVLDDSGDGTDYSVVAGIEWAVDQGIRVLNMSFGADTHSQTLQDACDAAYAAGRLLVAAVGNSGNAEGTGDMVLYPARYDSVIAVAASDTSDNRASFSSTGPAVELIAPGFEIVTTDRGSRFDWKEGTSMASPHVAGTAVLAWAANPDLTNVQIRGILQETAEDLGLPPEHQGYGLVRPDLAVAAALNTSPPAPGYTFTAPPAISLGSMAPGTRATGSSSGSLVGDNSAGYTVTAIDVKTEHAGYMVSADHMLSNKLEIGPEGDQLGPADEFQTLLDVDAAGSYLVSFHVSQEVAYTDFVAEGYTITITFTVTERE
jgi:subtilisin